MLQISGMHFLAFSVVSFLLSCKLQRLDSSLVQIILVFCFCLSTRGLLWFSKATVSSLRLHHCHDELQWTRRRRKPFAKAGLPLILAWSTCFRIHPSRAPFIFVSIFRLCLIQFEVVDLVHATTFCFYGYIGKVFLFWLESLFHCVSAIFSLRCDLVNISDKVQNKMLLIELICTSFFES